MGEERLLERIRSWKNEPQRRSRGEPRRQIDSIVAHLQRILNTRQGNVPIADGYGVPDLTDSVQASLADGLRSEKTKGLKPQWSQPHKRVISFFVKKGSFPPEPLPSAKVFP
jgi:type VI secretion system protein